MPAILRIPGDLVAIEASRGDYKSFWLGLTAVVFGMPSTLAFILMEVSLPS